jgi:hypothetical protein
MTERRQAQMRREMHNAGVSRRDALRTVAAATAVVAFSWTPDEVARAARLVRADVGARRQAPGFFRPDEWETVRVLVDMIIPRDDHSGSATDAGVPEFIDFLMLDGDDESRQTAMRGGLAWLDTECRERFDRDFRACTDEQRRDVLDDIAYPARAAPHVAQGVAFFTSIRNLTATGFWSSKMGMADLQYIGNTVVAEWTGCPEAQLRKLGIRSE